MPLKRIGECADAQRGQKGASLALLAQSGACVPDAWIWLKPRRNEDLKEVAKAGTQTVILRASEPLWCDPQQVSGAYPSQIVSLNELTGAQLDSWREAAYPVVLHCYIAAKLGGAAHIAMTDDKAMKVHLSWAYDISRLMNGSDSGMELWFGDLSPFEREGFGVPLLIARATHIPVPFLSQGFVSDFLCQVRPVATVLGSPFEVEWIISEAGTLIFLQLLRLATFDKALEAPWVHADALLYTKQKVE